MGDYCEWVHAIVIKEFIAFFACTVSFKQGSIFNCKGFTGVGNTRRGCMYLADILILNVLDGCPIAKDDQFEGLAAVATRTLEAEPDSL